MGRREIGWRIAVLLLLIAGGSLLIWALHRPSPGPPAPIDPTAVLAGLTLEQKVAQMVMAGFPGDDLSAEARALVSQYCLGGVMLAARNIRDARQTANLTSQLQKLAAEACAGIPLFIAADQEGGYVVRLPGRHRFPGNMALGAAGDPALAQRVGRAMGRELRAAGINLNFAPVLDVNSNPANPVIGIRSFGEQPELVADLGVAFIAGLQEAGVLATAKHFPGHGDTAQDSHLALPTVVHSRPRLDAVELLPFCRAVAAGVDAVMTAHVTFPAVDPTPGLPATLSAKALTGLLRREMNFSGLIITDALEMRAIADHFGLADAAVRAVRAGADIVLVAWPADWRQALYVLESLTQAVREGVVPQSRIDEAVLRILTVKAAAGLWDPAWAQPLTETDRQEIAAAAEAAAARAITLVRDQHRRLPLAPDDEVLVITPALPAVTGAEVAAAEEAGAEHAGDEGNALIAALRRYIPNSTGMTISAQPDGATRRELVAQAGRYDVVVLATYCAWTDSYAGQAQLVHELTAAGRHRG